MRFTVQLRALDQTSSHLGPSCLYVDIRVPPHNLIDPAMTPAFQAGFANIVPVIAHLAAAERRLYSQYVGRESVGQKMRH